MCYDTNARPPDPPGSPAEATGEDLELISADGTHFAAYFAHPANPTSANTASQASVIIYPDVRGLHPFYKELALRFAEQGIQALAIDYFGRTAGLTPRDDAFDFMPHVQQIQFPTFLTDVRAAIAYLQSPAATPKIGAPSGPPQPTIQNPKSGRPLGHQNPQSIFTLGFCMGGALSLLTAAEDLPLSGVIAFYSGFSRTFPGAHRPTLEQSVNIRVPVLGVYGGADQGIPPSQVHELGRNLDAARVEHHLIIYPGAPHSFFDRKAPEYAEASADAWNRVLTFIAAHSK